MPITELDASNYDDAIKAAKGVSLVRLHALWCEHCRMSGHTIEKAAREFHGDANFFEVNVGQNRALARALQLENIPAIAWYIDGELQEICVGVFTLEELKAKIDSFKALPVGGGGGGVTSPQKVEDKTRTAQKHYAFLF